MQSKKENISKNQPHPSLPQQPIQTLLQKKTLAAKNNATPQPKPISSHQTSIEDVTEEDYYIHPNAGPVKNPNAILEAADRSDDTDMVIDDNHDDPKCHPWLLMMTLKTTMRKRFKRKLMKKNWVFSLFNNQNITESY
jgi:hypothetical protein